MDSEQSKPDPFDPGRLAFEVADCHDKLNKLRGENALWRIYAAATTQVIAGMVIWPWL